ncbi:hypothetical protein EV714DRAFT_277518 [Schizophyllum commune]
MPLQICIFSPYREDVVDNVRKAMAVVPGVQAVYMGQQVEKDDSGICVLQWKSDLKSVVSNIVANVLHSFQPASHLEYNEIIKVAPEDGGEDEHVLSRLFSVPVQELTLATLKQSEGREQWKNLLQRRKLRLAMGAPRALGGFVDGIEERNSYRYVVLVGWDSYEAASLAKEIEGRGIIEDMQEVVELDVKYAKRKMYGGRD